MVKWSILSGILGLVVGFALGRIRPKNLNFYEFLNKIYKNLDNFILLLSTFIVVGSISLAAMDRLEQFASAAINIFSSIVFSWILTKKSSREDFKKQEEELALRSYRHINYIESAANTAYKKIEQYINDMGEADIQTKLMLSSATDQIKYIQGGINTCKMDWHDMLSDDEKKHYSVSSEAMDEEYGKVDINMAQTEYNQEDA